MISVNFSTNNKSSSSNLSSNRVSEKTNIFLRVKTKGKTVRIVFSAIHSLSKENYTDIEG